MISDDRAEFATTIFFRECMRQYVAMYPGKYAAGDMPVQPLQTYSPAHQRAVVKAFMKGLEAAVGMEELFQKFVAEKRAIEALNAQARSGQFQQ